MATCNLNVIVVLEFILKQGPIPATCICNTSLLKFPKFNFLPTHETEVRP